MLNKIRKQLLLLETVSSHSDPDSYMQLFINNDRNFI